MTQSNAPARGEEEGARAALLIVQEERTGVMGPREGEGHRIYVDCLTERNYGVHRPSLLGLCAPCQLGYAGVSIAGGGFRRSSRA